VKGQDSRNKLWAFMHADLPAVNSLLSAYICLEKPTVFGALKGIKKKLGKEAFPLIDQNYYCSHRNMLVTPEYPFVAKMGPCHAGYGKMKVDTSTQYQDLTSIVALHQDYVTLEKFIDWDYDMRIQKIGPFYRSFRRMSPNWKGNVGNMSILEDMELTERHKLMIDECAKLWGGIEICALDLVHCKETDREYILELNDTAIGLVHKYADEDMGYMRDIVVAKMNIVFGGQAPTVATTTTTTTTVEEQLKDLSEESKILKIQLERQKAAISKLLEDKKKAEQLASQKKAENENDDGDNLLLYLKAAAVGLLAGAAIFAVARKYA